MIFKTDKLDYLQGKIFFDDLSSIVQGPSNVGKLNWNLLGFSSFIFILGQCEWSFITNNIPVQCEGIGLHNSFFIITLFFPYFYVKSTETFLTFTRRIEMFRLSRYTLHKKRE